MKTHAEIKGRLLNRPRLASGVQRPRRWPVLLGLARQAPDPAVAPRSQMQAKVWPGRRLALPTQAAGFKSVAASAAATIRHGRLRILCRRYCHGQGRALSQQVDGAMWKKSESDCQK